jgi:hypothetical protein
MSGIEEADPSTALRSRNVRVAGDTPIFLAGSAAAQVLHLLCMARHVSKRSTPRNETLPVQRCR